MNTYRSHTGPTTKSRLTNFSKVGRTGPAKNMLDNMYLIYRPTLGRLYVSPCQSSSIVECINMCVDSKVVNAHIFEYPLLNPANTKKKQQ